MNALAAALAHARSHRAHLLEELKEFIRFPSVGAQPEHAGDLRSCAEWLALHLRRLGMRARVIATPGHPLVHAEWRRAQGRPTVLIYGHYDVQPADPLEGWTSPPFDPVVRGDDLFGRGACDDKGQLWVHVKALEAYLATSGALPVNVICLFEGEEETGSGHLLTFLRRRGPALGADVALLSDMRMRSATVPAITYGLRGALTMELEVRGPARDLHSGLFGGAVHNPLQALCEIVAGFHDSHGRVAVPGFYETVAPLSPRERENLARTGPADAEVLREAGAPAAWGEEGYSLYERTSIRPALSVNGILGGYAGEGTKAVIPARAIAKLSFRLAPGQDPAEVDRLFRRYVARLTPLTVRSSVRTGFGAMPALMDRRHAAFRAAAAALRESFGKEPVFLRSGGTMPVVNAILHRLQIPALLIGFARPDDRIHAPDEKFHLPNLYRGIDTSIRLLARLGNESLSTANHSQHLSPAASGDMPRVRARLALTTRFGHHSTIDRSAGGAK